MILDFYINLVLSSTFPTVLLCTRRLLPGGLKLVSKLFFNFTFKVTNVTSTMLKNVTSGCNVRTICGMYTFVPLLKLITYFLPGLGEEWDFFVPVIDRAREAGNTIGMVVPRLVPAVYGAARDGARRATRVDSSDFCLLGR